MNKKRISIISIVSSIAVICAIVIPITIHFSNKTVAPHDIITPETNEVYETSFVDERINKQNATDIQDTSEATSVATYVNAIPLQYSGVYNPGLSVANFQSKQSSAGTSQTDFGFIPATSLYSNITLTPIVGGVKQTPVSMISYCAACHLNAHCFNYVDVVTDGTWQIELKFTRTSGNASLVVLPESRKSEGKISYSMSGSVVTAIISDIGDYTFVFNDTPGSSYTVMFAYRSPIEVPEGYTKSEIKPGKYGYKFTQFNDPYSYVVFKAGVYDIQAIQVMASNVILYFEEGCYFRCHQIFEEGGIVDQKEMFLTVAGESNIKILGRALYDFSMLAGGDSTQPKHLFTISSDNTIVEGVTVINGNHWSICVEDAYLPEIRNCMLLSYRTYSDGIMMSNCRGNDEGDEVLYARVHHNFCRVGDDGLEVKGTQSSQIERNYVKFDHNTVWTDAGYAYGFTYECVSGASNIVYENNSVGFAQANWDNRCGVLVAQVGTNATSEIRNFTFENIEIYKAYKHLFVAHCTDEDQERSKEQGKQVYTDTFGGAIHDITLRNISYKSIVGNMFWSYYNIGSAAGTDAYEKSMVRNIYFQDIYANGVKATSLNASYSGNRASQITNIYFEGNLVH